MKNETYLTMFSQMSDDYGSSITETYMRILIWIGDLSQINL